MFKRLYRALDARYPLRILAAAVRVENVVVILGVAGLALYVRVGFTDFLLLAALGVAGQEGYALSVLRYFRSRLAPVQEWIGGERTEELGAVAWTVAASMPFELLRFWWRGVFAIPAGIAWAVFATWLLGLAAWSIPILFLAAEVVLAYGNWIAFFLVERAMQPLLDDLATQLSDETEIDAVRLPLRVRLLTALPAVNVFTGALVAGVVQGGRPGLGALGVAVGVSLVVTLTFALLFTLLLADSVVAPIRRLEAATVSVGAGALTTRVPVSSADETGTLTHAFNRMVSGLQERERLREAFGTFVDPDLAERVARDGTDLRGEELEVSILFMDVRGFTALAESSAARDVVRRLNSLYDVVVPVILAHGGHANKFIGDGLLAVFGAPERHPDHADRAVAAALQIAGEINEDSGEGLRVGLGVNSGKAVVGTIGGGGRLDFTVIGDAVNTAARVESATRETGDDLLITSETRARLQAGSVGWEERPSIPLKGKTEPVALYAPSRDRSAANPADVK
jgi:class 3 adenylate cyclase